MQTGDNNPEMQWSRRRFLTAGSLGSYAVLMSAMKRAGERHQALPELAESLLTPGRQIEALGEIAEAVFPVPCKHGAADRQDVSNDVFDALNDIKRRRIRPLITMDKESLTIATNTAFLAGSDLCDFLAKALPPKLLLKNRSLMPIAAPETLFPQVNIKFPRHTATLPLSSLFKIMESHVEGTGNDFWIFDSPGKQNYKIAGKNSFIYSGLIMSLPPENYMPDVVEVFRQQNSQSGPFIRAARFGR